MINKTVWIFVDFLEILSDLLDIVLMNHLNKHNNSSLFEFTFALELWKTLKQIFVKLWIIGDIILAHFLKPRMFQGILSWDSLGRIYQKKLFDEILHLFRNILENLMLKIELAFFYFGKQLLCIFPVKWWLATQENV